MQSAACRREQAAVAPVNDGQTYSDEAADIEGVQPPMDPAQIAAQAMLLRALAEAGETRETVTAKEKVVLVVAPTDEWATSLKKAWRECVAETKRTVSGRRHLSRYTDTTTKVFDGEALCSTSPRGHGTRRAVRGRALARAQHRGGRSKSGLAAERPGRGRRCSADGRLA